MLYSDPIPRLIRPSEGFYTSEVYSPRRLPVRTFLPTGYEPRYPYPLVIFFHDHGSNEEHILRLAPHLSRRNFICIGLRGPYQLESGLDDGAGCSWGEEAGSDAELEDYVFEAIEQSAETYHIHPNRIYLMGICEGSRPAYRLALTFPERFAGVISLNGAVAQHRRPLLRLPQARRLRVFIGHGIANARVPLTLARDDYRLLYHAGLHVEYHTYPTTHRLHADMFRDINRWIIRHCEE